MKPSPTDSRNPLKEAKTMTHEKIDPATCLLKFRWEDLGGGCIGREYYARNPGSKTWVVIHMLPEKIRDAIWAREDSKYICFPYGNAAPRPARRARLKPSATDSRNTLKASKNGNDSDHHSGTA
jgi:hypothetical protein